MISVKVTRTDEDTGAEVECGEVRLLETGVVFSYRETADGAGVMRAVVARLKVEVPASRVVESRADEQSRRAVEGKLKHFFARGWS